MQQMNREVKKMIKMSGNKRVEESSKQNGKKQSWKQSAKTFFLVAVVLICLGTIMATGGCGGSDSGSSSSTTSGTVSGSGK